MDAKLLENAKTLFRSRFSYATWTLPCSARPKIKFDPSNSRRYKDLPKLEEDPLLEEVSELSGKELLGISAEQKQTIIDNLRYETPDGFSSDLEEDSSYESYRLFCSLPDKLYPVLEASKVYPKELMRPEKSEETEKEAISEKHGYSSRFKFLNKRKGEDEKGCRQL
ncbi:Oidioi.mRNA.OKI2018_I69.chr2.g6898.t1.cds [Oikopleura dioica]|uniref:Oidioi.mRNA.OKI2018_I69.chr2.g6898.t1.cds n=1 Tax=Oikopleura dioica TaxID=34765 RepID=A0ABN7TB96_OIKDI|nr:Oidioi.mRNA.OKI2018_I69.chr2.g6898.t1.cds [Oikopleura dioica]